MEAGAIKATGDATLKCVGGQAPRRGNSAQVSQALQSRRGPRAHPMERFLAGLPLLRKRLRRHIFAEVQTLSWQPSQRRGDAGCQSPRAALPDRDCNCLTPLKKERDHGGGGGGALDETPGPFSNS